MRCEHLHDSAVYVLGALSPEEREAYERHLVDCAECQAEVAEFGELPELLGKLDPDVAQALTAEAAPQASGWAGPSAASWAGPSAAASWAGPSAVPAAPASAAAADPLLPRILDRAQRNRRTDRRRRRWQSAGTALVAACLGVLAVIGVRTAGVGQPDFVAMQEVAATVPVTASLALEGEDDGTSYGCSALTSRSAAPATESGPSSFTSCRRRRGRGARLVDRRRRRRVRAEGAQPVPSETTSRRSRSARATARPCSFSTPEARRLDSHRSYRSAVAVSSSGRAFRLSAVGCDGSRPR